MATSNCNQNCGCNNSYTVTTTCPPSCTEVFNAQCIVYTGTDITCGDDTVISRYDYLDTIVTKLVNYFCNRFDSLVIPTTVVESDDPGIVVTEQVVGSVTTYVLTLNTAEIGASVVTAGDNVVVTGDGSSGDPYVVNANESIVAVDPASSLTLVVDPSTPGPYETTYTVGWSGATTGAGLSGTGLLADPLINTANIFSDITGDAGPGLTASGLTDSVYISGGKGIATDSGTNPGIVEIVADVAKYAAPVTAIGASATVNFTHNLNTLNVTVSVIDLILPLPHTMFTQGVDYSVQIVNTNEISITDLTGAGLPNAGVTVIG